MNINRKSIAATMILAASVIPAFAQSRGHGSARGAGRPQFEQQRNAPRNDSFRNRPAPQRAPQIQQRFQSQPQQRQFAQPRTAFRSQGNVGNSFRGNRRVVIPQNRFHASFGRDHFFRIGRPVFYGRYPRFQYGGFWFNFASAPPAYWGPDWYNSDDVYIDYNDGGYYLYDNRYPGQGVPLDVDSGDYNDNGGNGNVPPDDGYDDNSYPNQ